MQREQPGLAQRHPLVTLWLWLTEPFDRVPREFRRQSQLAASLWLLLIITAILFLALTINFLNQGDDPSAFLARGLLPSAFWLLPYWLSRRGQYKLATALVSVSIVVALSFVISPNGRLQNQHFGYYMILPVLAYSVFFSVRTTALAAAVITVYQIGLFMLSVPPDLHYAFYVSPLLFVPLMSLIITTSSVYRNWLERDRQTVLAAEELRLRTVLQSMPVMLDAFDERGNIILWNRECERVTGFSAEEIVNQPDAMQKLYPNPDYLRQMLDERAKDSNYQNEEWRIACKDGSERIISWSNITYQVPIPGWDEWGIGIDVTERKKAETEQQQRERELEAIATTATALRQAQTQTAIARLVLEQVTRFLAAGGAAISLKQESGDVVIEEASGAWSAIEGLRLASGQGVGGWVLQQGKPYVTQDITTSPIVAFPHTFGGMLTVAAVPLIAEHETIGVLSFGRTTPIRDDEVTTLMAIADIAANALHRAGVTQTLEQRVQQRTAELAAANERLRELDRIKTKLIGDISHELRTPISTLGLMVYLLENDKSGKSQASRIRTLSEQIRRLRELVEGVNEILALELSRHSMEPSPVNFNRAVGDAVSASQPQASAQGLTLTFQPDPHVPPIPGEYTYLVKAARHLLNNALRYTPSGEIHVATEYDADARQICLTVRDSGVGIHPEDLPFIFDRFYRGRQAAQSNIPGLGIGLSAVRVIVEMHGGQIYVESAPDQGTTMRILFPASSMPANSQVPLTPADSSLPTGQAAAAG